MKNKNIEASKHLFLKGQRIVNSLRPHNVVFVAFVFTSGLTFLYFCDL